MTASCASAPTCETSTSCLEEARQLAPPSMATTDSNAGRDALWAAGLYGQACEMGSREGCEQHLRYWLAATGRNGIPSHNSATGRNTTTPHEDVTAARAASEIERSWPTLTRLAFEDLMQNAPNDRAAHQAYLADFGDSAESAQVRARLAVILGNEYAASGQLGELFRLARSGPDGAGEAEPRLYELLRNSEDIEAIAAFCGMFSERSGEPVESHLRELFARWLTLMTQGASSLSPASRGMQSLWSMKDAHPHWNSNLPALADAVRERALREEDPAARLESWRTFFTTNRSAFRRFANDFEAVLASVLPSMSLDEMIALSSRRFLRGRAGENVRSTIGQTATTRARAEVASAWSTVRAANAIDQTRDFISRWELVGLALEIELQPIGQARQLLARQERQAEAAAAAEERRENAQAIAEERRDAALDRRCERVLDDLSEGQANCNTEYVCDRDCDANRHCNRLRQRPNAFERCRSNYSDRQYEACFRRCAQQQASRNRFCAQLNRANRAAEALGCN